MAGLIPGMENISINLAGQISQIIYYLGIILGSGLSIGTLYAVYYVSRFRIKATVFPLFGSGKDGVFSFGKPKMNRVRWVNNHTAWRSLFPLFNKKDKEPFDPEMVYPGNRIYVFALGEEWSPGRINIKQTEDEIRGEVNPVPHYVRNWQSLQHKKNAMEFAQHSFWEDNKTFIMTIVCVAICAALCLTTVYFTYKFTTTGVQQAGNVADAIRNFGSIAGK